MAPVPAMDCNTRNGEFKKKKAININNKKGCDNTLENPDFILQAHINYSHAWINV
jgi:hypothetical protein